MLMTKNKTFDYGLKRIYIITIYAFSSMRLFLVDNNLYF